MEKMSSSSYYTLINSFNNSYGLADKYCINTTMFDNDYEELEDQLQDLHIENFDLMYHFVLSESDLQCSHEWNLKDGMKVFHFSIMNIIHL